MLAFIRGSGTFMTGGQIYVKRLPEGDPVQLTHDDLWKMSPTFSPDGKRVAYSTLDLPWNWDTTVVPVPGGAPHTFLSNASGLVWTGPRGAWACSGGVGSTMRRSMRSWIRSTPKRRNCGVTSSR